MKNHAWLLFVFVAATASWAPLGAAGDTRVVDAARKRNLADVRALVRQKVDVNAPQPDGATALHWAVYADDVAMTELLMRAGANVNTANALGAAR